ncbi:MAG: molecular chaperone GrpE [Methylothermaceae bacteria B42]|nr:MAG: molecular chaperone GrpE [Methylothermaceae bacteria B42]HHJ38695.1 nucleotide exchange factor GrpE [Methylothermaceae bacterium]
MTASEEMKDPQQETAVENPETEALSDEVGILRQQLTEAEKKAEENWEKFLRAQAEMENLRRRMERELENAQKYALEKFAKELLSVVDSLELGLQAAVETDEVEKIREGVELTLKQMLTVLERFNITPIDPTGEKFDPEFHQAMATEPVKGVEPDTVVKVFQKGYLLNDRLIRPALVVVAKPPDGEQHIDEQA